MKSSLLPFILLVVSGYAQAATYSKTAGLSGESFLDAFSWETSADPNHGRVTYVDKATAGQDGLYSVSDNTVTLRTDDKTVLDPSGPGRNAIRLISNKQYSNHVAVFDIAHMPEGCGTWPMILFEVGAKWPTHGEIDVLAGVNNATANQANVQTGPNCTMPDYRPGMTGTSVDNDCNSNATHYNGCGVLYNNNKSFGPAFNRDGGGWFASERSADHVSLWFWDRSWVPAELLTGDNIDTSTWGTPDAYFPNTDCDYSTLFGPMNIIIAVTFCGDWATPSYSQLGCPSTCVDFVNNNPGAFTNAYFTVNAMNIYE